MRRVVVTGIGLVTPLGIGADNNWKRLVAGESGIRAIQSFDVSDLPAKIQEISSYFLTSPPRVFNGERLSVMRFGL